MTSLISIIVVLGAIVFVHELGHFLAAKIVGIRVEQFSLGFPPKIFSRKFGETEYLISWIPLGGYVKMAGMIDESLDDKPLTGEPWEFMSKNYLQKVFVISAGVIMNLLLAFLIFTVITLYSGIGELGAAKIGAVDPGMPADSVGLRPGDLIVSIDNDTIAGWEEMAGHIRDRAGETIEIAWTREGVLMKAKVVPVAQERLVNGEKVEIAMIGIGAELERRPAGIVESIVNGADATYYSCSATVIGLYMLTQGEASIKDFTGPVGIAQYSGQALKTGFTVFLSFLAFISANVGLFNILPIPVLDGGHLVFINIEAIIRRPVSTKIKMIIQQVGMVLLLLLFIIISFNDIMRLFS